MCTYSITEDVIMKNVHIQGRIDHTKYESPLLRFLKKMCYHSMVKQYHFQIVQKDKAIN